MVINWGCGTMPNWPIMPMVLNQVEYVRIASNKLSTFNALVVASIADVPEWTDKLATAEEWTEAGKIVVCRTLLNGHSGAGIKIAARSEDLPINCPLFVVYKKKKKEYRVHVAFGEVIDVQEKRKRHDFNGQVDFAVRNHHTGWVYCRDGVVSNNRIADLAIRSVQSVGLDFGAVDIIYNEHDDLYYVLEINTAPGLEGTTIDNYANAFTKELRKYG